MATHQACATARPIPRENKLGGSHVRTKPFTVLYSEKIPLKAIYTLRNDIRSIQSAAEQPHCGTSIIRIIKWRPTLLCHDKCQRVVAISNSLFSPLPRIHRFLGYCRSLYATAHTLICGHYLRPYNNPFSMQPTLIFHQKYLFDSRFPYLNACRDSIHWHHERSSGVQFPSARTSSSTEDTSISTAPDEQTKCV